MIIDLGVWEVKGIDFRVLFVVVGVEFLNGVVFGD